MTTKFQFAVSTILFCLTASTCLAQSATGQNIDDHLLIKDAKKNLGLEDGVDVVGTPYLNKSFADGEVVFDNGSRNAVPLRYNIHKDWVEFRQNNQTYVLDPDNRIKRVTIAQDVYVVDKFKSNAPLGYYKLLDSGQVSLLSKQVVLYKEYQPAQALQSSASPPKYTRVADQFFLKVGQGELRKVDNVKNVILAFPDKHDALKEFAKKEGISTKNEEDLKQLIAYYNSLSKT
jgi:hypothetical protein